MVSDPIKIQGLREFSKALKDLDAELPKALRVAFNGATKFVATEAQLHVPTISGRAKASVKARSTRTEARVVGGGKRVPYYPWLDFGGRVGRNRSVHRPFLKDGRYIYKAFFDNRERFGELLEQALIEVAEQAGMEVNRGG